MSEPIQYLEWDWANDKAREWRRLGECNGCGQCCTAAIHFYASAEGQASAPNTFGKGKHKNFAKINDKGLAGPVVHEIRQGKHRRTMSPVTVGTYPDKPCGELAEGKCKVHQFKNWKRRIIELCDIWPIHPSQVTPFDQCSYSFELVREWSISGQAAK